MGGFGNQLFQLCAGLSATPEKRKMFIYQKDSNTDMKKLVSRLIKQGVEVELIPSERIMFAQVANRAIGLLISLELGNRHTYFPRIFKSLLKAIAVSILYPFLKVRGIYVAPELGDVPILEKSNAKLIVGYFQTFRTSENTEVYKVLQRALDEIELDNDKERVSENSNGNLVIHIRLGDYLAEKNFGVLGTNYYLNALRMISKDGIERISIFSDDIEKARAIHEDAITREIKSIFGERIRMSWIQSVDGSTLETFNVMRKGSHFIIANSSFSWWAARLSQKKAIEVIAPWPWFKEMDSPTNLLDPRWLTANPDFKG